MNNLFSSRYKDLLDDNDLSIDLNDDLKRRLIRKLMEFDEPFKTTISRYDGYMVDSSTRIEAFEQYSNASTMGQLCASSPQDDEKWLFENKNSVLFDFIELWFSNLSQGEQRDFQDEINFLLHDSKAPWFLLNGKLIKQDSKQFEQDLLEQSLERISEYPEFSKVVEEFEEALMHYNLNDYKKTILYCEMSYESLLKIICSKNDGQAAQLTSAFVKS